MFTEFHGRYTQHSVSIRTVVGEGVVRIT